MSWTPMTDWDPDWLRLRPGRPDLVVWEPEVDSPVHGTVPTCPGCGSEECAGCNGFE